jgi:hypothetical protein
LSLARNVENDHGVGSSELHSTIQLGRFTPSWGN